MASRLGRAAAIALHGALLLVFTVPPTHAQSITTVGKVADQLLVTDGIDPNSAIQVFDSTDAFLEAGAAMDIPSPALGSTTVFGSALVTSSSSNGGGNTTSDSGPQGQTQIYYNCTSAPNIWDYRRDANIKTEDFVEVKVLNASESNTTVQARFAIRNCGSLRNYSAAQLVAGNEFFGQQVASLNVHFRVQESDVEERGGTAASDVNSPRAPTSCLVTVLLVRATVKELYPECDIKFKSTDVRSLFPNRRFGRGAGSSSASGTQTFARDALKTTVNVYMKDPLCDLECGVAATNRTDKFSAGVPGIDRCYDCASELSPSACPSTYPYSAETSCCRQLLCTASMAPIDSSDEDVMTWNVADDGVTILDPSVVFYQRGDCSDLTSQSSDCCRIVCRNCFVQLDLDSVEFDYSVFKFTASGKATVTGRGSLTLAVFAPNGCLIESLEDIKLPFNDVSVSYWGFSVGVSIELFRHNQLYIKTHNSEVVLGANFVMNGFTGGFENARKYASGDAEYTPTTDVRSSSLDIKLQTGYVFKVMVSLSFLRGLAAIHLGVQTEVFYRVEASVSTPLLFPALPTPNYKTSLVSVGDCRLPHFMRFDVATGYEDTRLVFSYTLLYRDSDDYYFHLPAIRYSKSLRSGCVAPAYSARFAFAVQRSVLQVLLDDDVRKLRLMRALAKGLLFPDLDPNAMRIVDVSAANGTVEVEMSVPPAIADEFSSPSRFALEARARAKSPFFTSYVSAEVGVPVNAVCPPGFWGFQCDKTCSAVACGTSKVCEQPLCDAVTGETFACGACAGAAFWGDTCEIGCLPPDACSNATCAQENGEALACGACNDGYWGKLCNRTCSTPGCVVAKCNMTTGEVTSCARCEAGATTPFCVSPGSSDSARVARASGGIVLVGLLVLLRAQLL
ncbi:hypothetical protein PybrP1_004877 [[Pythium] brassicae (nom. inval.)]|nr:hypothetical protein PybrP1_004877 [[Pythium] brassicae (nom. inval.)]